MLYKFHDYKFQKIADKYYDIIRSAMNNLGHSEVVEDNPADYHFYNHTTTDTKDVFIVKPTAPTSNHFAIDTMGYANSSALSFTKPDINNDMDWESIIELRNTKPNKWDDSVLLKWRNAKGIPDDHILVIGQMPDDETVHGFGFGDHIVKLKMIVDKLHSRNVVIKLHPRYKNPVLVKKWEDAGHTVITGYQSIHSILPKTRVAFIDNSTAGIECMMHSVPTISYGWPEYHWVTQKLQTLSQLNDLLKLDWYSPTEQEMFLHWYINRYLCKDVESTTHRLSNILWKT